MGWFRKKKAKYDIVSKRGAMLLEDLIECCDGKSNPIKSFSADEICKATNNFSDSNHISKLSNSDYRWYKGKTKNHQKILIKKPEEGLYIYREGHLCRDISVSSMVSGHKNFLKLVGCCLEFEDPVMVYHRVKKYYSLDISEEPWSRRMKLAEDIVTALAYLHTAFPRPFVHTSMCLGNIFVDEDGVVMLSDFSCCVSIPKGETFVQVKKVVGTYNYLDDKYMRSGVVSEETDVFAIGMFMILKLLTGKESFLEFYLEGKDEDKDDGESEDYGSDNEYESKMRRRLQKWLSKLKEDRVMEEIVDPKMLEMMGGVSELELCQMKAFLTLSLRCTRHKGEVPTMVEVAKELKKMRKYLNSEASSSG
ncbi:hypothetical protein CARUB_v10021880mg [Capsella rubella]|uniref:Protein kinase domain-containing protein n=1 Tax=Capsella rubella TaxID=81985 RepID=R0GEV9_9BRAS|nr:hypothetical protein CARUB_v10021880mg [Capsella rubella]